MWCKPSFQTTITIYMAGVDHDEHKNNNNNNNKKKLNIFMYLLFSVEFSILQFASVQLFSNFSPPRFLGCSDILSYVSYRSVFFFNFFFFVKKMWRKYVKMLKIFFLCTYIGTYVRMYVCMCKRINKIKSFTSLMLTRCCLFAILFTVSCYL